MASYYHFARTAITRQLRTLLESFHTPMTRGLSLRVQTGHVTVETIPGCTNTEWRKFKVLAAERERAFTEWAKPQIESILKQIKVHPATWRHVSVAASIKYFTGNVEVNVKMVDPLGFEKNLRESEYAWDGSLKQKPVPVHAVDCPAPRMVIPAGAVCIDLTNE